MKAEFFGQRNGEKREEWPRRLQAGGTVERWNSGPTSKIFSIFFGTIYLIFWLLKNYAVVGEPKQKHLQTIGTQVQCKFSPYESTGVI